ncbi:MFS transporter [Plantactinospora sp. BB1]|uniref:MFS transporter n=1 Tax=Plantactinospora sp. BB1 TaxID=2071627 RepID=UPI000D152244|nr:MFS transporter [Plantactinospora sp. BB1]AVT38774.1 MFS transporter [Plantactinospora sp. BB1]
MPVTSSPAPTARARRLTTTFYLYAFLDDFVLLYPVYALLFTDTGLSVAQISSLFVVWSLTGILLEVPSGVWADAVSRRLLLAVAPLLGAVGFGLWVAAPSYWVFALGFVLWGVRGALQSGAAEALLYDELDRLGLADRYGRVIGRASTVSLLGALLAIAVATPVFAAGGYPAVGVASVLASLLCAVVGLALPEHRTPAPGVGVPTGPETAGPGLDRGSGGGVAPSGELVRVAPAQPATEDPSPGPLAILRVALAEARNSRAVRRALLLLPAMLGIWGGLEEYLPLLAGEVTPTAGVPLLVLLVWAGVMLGGLLTPLGQRLTARRFGAAVGAASIALAVGALAGRPAGFVLVAAAFCVLQMASLVADVRLQESITGPARATVTSLAGLGTELVTIGVYGGYALASTVAGHGVVFALLACPYLVLAVALRRAGASWDRRRPVPGGRR